MGKAKKNSYINGKEYFRIRRKIGEKNGKPVYKNFYGTSESDAKHHYEEWNEERMREKYERNVTLDLSTLSERADEFIENALKPSQNYAHGSKTRYISSYNTHVRNSSLAGMIAHQIKASDIQRFYNGLDVSKSTLKQVHKFMSAFYKWMVRNEYANDVLSAVELPLKPDTKKHNEIVVWTEDEIHTILDNLGDHRLRFLIYVLLYSGIRIGEAIALKYEDFDGDTLHIRRQKYLDEIKLPKSNSVRDIPLHDVLIKELPKHRKWHEAEMKQNGYKTDFVFTTRNGNTLGINNLRRSLMRYYKRIGIEPKHNHAYRSTFCTQLCKCNVPLEVASKLLGHSSIEVTAKHYALVQKNTKKDAISKLHY